MFKVVLDTNQYISALLQPQGLQARMIGLWRKRQYLLLTSPFILEELERVLRSLRISSPKYRLGEEDIADFVSLVVHEAIIVAGDSPPSIIRDDPSDNAILACAIQGEADCIVSGDHHLLDLKEYSKIPILTARSFLDRYFPRS